MNTKQVIVIRKDLNMRKGKMCAQASHASNAFLTKSGHVYAILGGWMFQSPIPNGHEDEVWKWIEDSFRKICVSVNSEEELLQVHQKALDAGLVSHLITDNGATEFHGVPTHTCCCIGPHWDEKFIDITDHLPLL
jgi:PTH2 family peptidyl-tRNA hydrolase